MHGPADTTPPDTWNPAALKTALRTICKRLRVSQSQLAQLADVNPSQISRWGSGATKPSYESVKRLWEAVARLDTDGVATDAVDQLITAAGYQPPRPVGEDPWKRLGRLLVTRRGEITPQYRNIRTWVEHAEQAGFTKQDILSLERGDSAAYQHGLVFAVESLYRIRPGSIGAAMAGGELIPDDEPEAPHSPEPRTISEEGGVRTIQATVVGPDGEQQVMIPVDITTIPGLESVHGEEREQLIQQVVGVAVDAAVQFLERKGRQRERKPGTPGGFSG